MNRHVPLNKLRIPHNDEAQIQGAVGGENWRAPIFISSSVQGADTSPTSYATGTSGAITPPYGRSADADDKYTTSSVLGRDTNSFNRRDINLQYSPERQLDTMMSNTASEWIPIWDDEFGFDALAAVVSCLKRCNTSYETLWDCCGLSILYAYLSQVENHEEWRDDSINCLNHVIDRLSNTRYSRPALFGGITGVAWAVEHVSSLLAEDAPLLHDVETPDALEDIDTLLLKQLSGNQWTHPYDLISGLVGIGLYFLERLPVPKAEAGIRRIVDHLEALSETQDGNITWRTSPEHLPAEHVGKCPDGYYNLGVAHGVPGIVGFLSGVASVGVETLRATQLIEGAVRWLMSQGLSDTCLFRFASWTWPGSAPPDSRLGWCYGDLGISTVLYGAARVQLRDDWRDHALCLLERCGSISAERGRIRDAALCHGAFGVAHIWNRMFQEERDTRYRDLALQWYRNALNYRDLTLGVAGFYAWKPPLEPQCQSDISLLSGAIGIALALISALYPVEPRWDRLLLLSSISGFGEPNHPAPPDVEAMYA